MREIRNANVEILNKSEFTNVQMLETREGVSFFLFLTTKARRDTKMGMLQLQISRIGEFVCAGGCCGGPMFYFWFSISGRGRGQCLFFWLGNICFGLGVRVWFGGRQLLAFSFWLWEVGVVGGAVGVWEFFIAAVRATEKVPGTNGGSLRELIKKVSLCR